MTHNSLSRYIRTRRCYAPELPVKMADEEAEQERSAESGISENTRELRRRLQEVQSTLVRESAGSLAPSARFCQDFCQVSTLSQASSTANCAQTPLDNPRVRAIFQPESMGMGGIVVAFRANVYAGSKLARWLNSS